MHPAIHARSMPEKAAYVMAGTGETVSYGELDRRSNQGAWLFRGLGLQPGDHVALLLDNCRHFFEVVFAAQRSGLVYTTISHHLKPAEAAYIVRDCAAKVLVTSKKLEQIAAPVRQQATGLLAWFMVDGVADGFQSYEEAVADQPGTPVPDQGAGFPMLYSSGTTGHPKGIQSSFEPFATLDMPAPWKSLAAAFRFTEQTIYLSPAPLYHTAPLVYVNITLHRGGTAIIMEKFDAERALALIQEHRVTHSQWVPIMFIRLLKLGEEQRRRYDLSSMRVAIHAAAPCPTAVKSRMIDWWGRIIYEYYGCTEGIGVTGITSEEWLQRPGSVGKPIFGEIRICNDQGDRLPAGETGTIYFTSGVRFEYYRDPARTRAAQHPQHSDWYTVGDVGHVDQDGYLFLTDRKDFMIISGGVNIYPREVEDCLVGHPGVADAAVLGVPSAEFGEEVKAVVQLVNPAAGGPDLAAELIDWCRARLSHVKCPRSIDFEQLLPRLDNGKLYKRLLRDRYWADRASRI